MYHEPLWGDPRQYNDRELDEAIHGLQIERANLDRLHMLFVEERLRRHAPNQMSM